MSTTGIRPQPLVFTLFGDYIRHKSYRIWIGSLIKLLALFGVSEQATRSTVSRMVRRGWLTIEREGTTSYYAMTPTAQKVINEGAARIFNFTPSIDKWNGCWHLVTYSIPEERREGRDTLRSELPYLGFGMLTNAMWISPHDQRARLDELTTALNIKPYVQIFTGRLEGFLSAHELVARCWNLDAINAGYTHFLEKHNASFCEFQTRLNAGEPIDPSEYFVRRFTLIHEYRAFPYRDPYLPADLLPAGWHGNEATALFQKYHQLLADGANDYFESVFR